MMKYPVPTAMLLLLSLAIFSGRSDAAMNQAGAAPMGNPMLPQLAQAGGAAEAAVELCGLDDDAVAAKQQQQQQFIQMGGTREQFEEAYSAGYDRAVAEHGNASPAERERMCEDLRQFGESEAGSGW